MKKIFSAFLLMTMMVASVGSFVSCSDIEDAIANVENAANDNAASIKDLESKIAALQTALQTAQSEAAAAKAEANAAKQAAATAKAEAIAAALAEIEKVNGDVDAVNAEIKKINDALAGCATKEAVELLQATIDEYKALTDENAEAIAALEEALAALGENVTPEQLAEVVAKMTAIDQALVAFQNRLQSVSYVPEWKDGPTAVLFEENEEYGFVHMSYEVAPAAYASKITAENTKLVGVALKGVEVEEHDVKILSADPETGIVEVIAYISVDSKVWEAKKDAEGKAVAAVALRVVAEDAQFTSAYTNVNVLGGDKAAESINDYVFFGTYNEDDEFVTNVYDEEKEAYQPATLTHTVSYDTPVADSEVALFEGLVARVNVPGFFEYVPVEEAAEMFGIEIKVTEKLSSFATKYFVTTVTEYNWVEDDDDEPETPAFIVAKDQTLDITVKFNETVVDSLKKAENLTSYKNAGASAALKAGYFQVNGEKAATFAGLTAVYDVVGPEKNLELVLNNNETINVEWTPKNYSERATLEIEDLDVTGGNARMLDEEITFDYTPLDKDGEPMAKDKAPAVTVEFISIDNADVTIDLTNWPEKATTYAYAFEGWYLDTETDTKVIVTFDVTIAVEAAPEQIGVVPVIEPTTLTLAKSGEYVADPSKVATTVALNGVVEKLLPYYKSYYKTEKEAKAEIVNAIKGGKSFGIYVVGEDGEMPTTAVGTATYTYKHDDGKAEDSKLAIAYNKDVYEAMSKKYVRFAYDVVLLGIKSTVVADYNVAEWTYVGYKPALKDGRLSPVFDGNQTFVITTGAKQIYKKDAAGNDLKDANGNKIVDWTYTFIEQFRSAVYTYDSYNFNFADYITIDVTEAAKANYKVRWYVKKANNLYVTNVIDEETSEDVVRANLPYYYWGENTNKLSEVIVLNAEKVATPQIHVDAIDNLVNGQFGIHWNGSSDITDLTVVFELVKVDSEYTAADYFDTAKVKYAAQKEVKFTTKATIASVDVTNVEFTYSPVVANNIANFATGITVTDLFGTVISNQGYDRTISTFWYDYKVDPNKTEDVVNNPEHTVYYTTDSGIAGGTLAYNQTIQIVEFDHDGDEDTDKVWITNNGGFEIKNLTVTGDEVKCDHFTFNKATGAFQFTGNTAPANDVTFTVMVEVGHMNDNGKPIQKTVNIVVKK